MIHLDDNAEAPVLPAAWDAYRAALDDFGNPSSAHGLGRQAKARLTEARERVARMLSCSADEIVFLSGGTEADALALAGTLADHAQAHVLTSTIEHAAVTNTLAALQRRYGLDVDRVPVARSGRLPADRVAALLTARTALVSVVMACNETGVLQPIKEIAALCRNRGILCHTDAAQAAGRVDIDFHELGVDLLTVSGHKVGAVPGIGALVIRRGVAVKPLLAGGGQEHNWRAGTENVAGAVSLAVALENSFDPQPRAALQSCRDRLERGLADRAGPIEILGRNQPRLPQTSCVLFPGCQGDGLMMALDVAGIMVSTGSACSTGAIEPSSILLGMGLNATEASSGVRFSLARQVTAAQIDEVIAATADIVRRMRAGA